MTHKLSYSLCFLFFLSAVFFSQLLAASLEVHFLDVGLGDCALLLFPSGEKMMIDCGDSSAGPKVVEYLAAKNISSLDFLVLTRPRKESIAGAPEVLSKIKVKKIYDSGQEYGLTFYEEIKGMARALPGTELLRARRNEKISGIADSEIAFLNPADVFITGGVSDIDENSIVVQVRYKEIHFLFAGAIGEKAQKMLLNQPGQKIRADVLKVSNFGARHSNNPEFLKAAGIKYAVISVGRRNRYDYPSDESLVVLNSLAKEVYRTDLDGHIICISDGSQVRIKKARSDTLSFSTARTSAPRGAKKKSRK